MEPKANIGDTKVIGDIMDIGDITVITDIMDTKDIGDIMDIGDITADHIHAQEITQVNKAPLHHQEKILQENNPHLQVLHGGQDINIGNHLLHHHQENKPQVNKPQEKTPQENKLHLPALHGGQDIEDGNLLVAEVTDLADGEILKDQEQVDLKEEVNMAQEDRKMNQAMKEMKEVEMENS